MTFPLSSRLAVLAMLSLSACGGVGSYPSLAPRPIERAETATTPEATPAALDPAVGAEVTALLAQAERGEAAMTAAVRTACPAIARGAGASQGSEAWIAAQQAISAIEASRRDTAIARESIEALVLDQARAAEDRARPVDLSALLAASDTIAARDTAQESRLQAIRRGDCTT